MKAEQKNGRLPWWKRQYEGPGSQTRVMLWMTAHERATVVLALLAAAMGIPLLWRYQDTVGMVAALGVIQAANEIIHGVEWLTRWLGGGA